MSPMTLDPPRTAPQTRWSGAPIERPVRVLHVVPELTSGGMERAMLRLIERSRLHDTQVPGGCGLHHGICVLKRIADDFADRCPPEVPTWVLGGDSRLGRFDGWRKLRRVLGEFGPDVVHARSTGTWFDAGAAVLGRADVRLLLSFHGRTTLEAPSLRRRLVDRWTTGRANAVLTVSQDSAQMLRTRLGVPGDKLCTIPNGVDTSQFYPAEAEAEILETRQRLRLHPSADVAVCVANLLPIKGLDLLIRAWRQIHMADPLAQLLLVGEGPLRSQLEQSVRESRCSNLVRFLGAREDVATLLRAADVFVLPSHYEGCSNATLEAMASGLPVVACDVGGMREIVTHNKTGWLVPSGQTELFGQTLLTLLLDRSLRNRAGAAGRDAAMKYFGIDTWVARHAALYRRLAGVRPPRQAALEPLPCAE